MKEQIGIIGGSGFVGRTLTELLCAHSYSVRTIGRRPQARDNQNFRAYTPGEPETLSRALQGCQVVINLVGILNQRLLHRQDFNDAHVRLVEQIVAACRQQKIHRLLHMSALNVSATGPGGYLQSKHRGEVIARNSGLQTTVFRPSVIFGRGDSFINRFARLLKRLPGPFPLACASTRFAPVYVGDVAQLMLEAISDPAASGRLVHVCGPRIYTSKEIVEYTASLLGKRTAVIALPDVLAKMQAHILGLMPGRPFTMDNYLSLQIDSVCSKKTACCVTRLEDIAPSYIHAS